MSNDWGTSLTIHPIESKRAHRDIAKPDDHQLLATLSQVVRSRFEHLTGQQIAICPLPAPSCPGASIMPNHPLCESRQGSPACVRCWNKYTTSLMNHPQPLWHRCVDGKLCAVVPIRVENLCIAACQLVCEPTVLEARFREVVETLRILVEHFVESEIALAERLGYPTSFAGEGQGIECMDRYQAYVHRSINYIKHHLTDPDLGLRSTARSVGVNPNYLTTIFTKQVGMRMNRYISIQRIALAKHLLATTEWPIKQVAYASGHKDARWFTTRFRSLVGKTPRQFRDSTHNTPGA